MADGRYTQKIRAKRIALEYFKQSHPFRRWKFILSVAAPVIAGLWLLASAVRGDQRLYTSGPVSTAHTMWNAECADCHTTPLGATKAAPDRKGFFVKVSDQTCETCHAGPVHHDNQSFTPMCATCHVEHKGHVALASLNDTLCVQCHADLGAYMAKGGTPSGYETKIRSFNDGHPEFAVPVKQGDKTVRVRLDQKDALKDTAQIKLNHQKHLKVGLKGLEELKKVRGTKGILQAKDGSQLDCTFCHETDKSMVQMQPVSYAKHCAFGCHPVDFGVEGALAPHDQPSLVHAYLRTFYIEAFEQCQPLAKDPKALAAAPEKIRDQCVGLGLAQAPAEATAAPGGGAEEGARPRGARGRGSEEAPPAAEPPSAPRGGRLGRSEATEEAAPSESRPRGRRGGAEAEQPAAAAAPSALDWASPQLQSAEKLVWKQKCEFCHTMTYAEGKVPALVPTAIPVRWLPHSTFDHGAHRPVGCKECHGKATMSTDTTDVLLPSATVCRECHRPRGGARAGCVECHQYHDKTQERDQNGPFTVRQLVRGPVSAGRSAGGAAK